MKSIRKNFAFLCISLLMVVGLQQGWAADEPGATDAAAQTSAGDGTNELDTSANLADPELSLSEGGAANSDFPLPVINEDQEIKTAPKVNSNTKSKSARNAAPNRIGVNPTAYEEDQLFLPPPGDTPVYLAPRESGISYGDAEDYQYRPYQRPVFSLFAGGALKTDYDPALGIGYDPTSGVSTGATTVAGIQVGADLRFWSITNFLTMHMSATVAWFSLGDLKPNDITADAKIDRSGTGGSTADNATYANRAQGVTDRIWRIGPTLELSLGKRFSLFGGIYYHFQKATAAVEVPSLPVSNAYSTRDLIIKRDKKIVPAGGLQYDFYIIPHAAVGARLTAEPNLYAINLIFAIEPIKQKRMSFNYEND